MTKSMKKLDVYSQILKDTVLAEMEMIDVLLRGVVLHTHSISLKPDVLLDDYRGENDRVTLSPLTRHHVASMLAGLWPPATQRGREEYWFAGYLAETPYELFEDIPEDLHDRAVAARGSIEAHPIVEALIPE